jgi:hypothetical protein
MRHGVTLCSELARAIQWHSCGRRRVALLQRDTAALARLMDRNFDLRRWAACWWCARGHPNVCMQPGALMAVLLSPCGLRRRCRNTQAHVW